MESPFKNHLQAALTAILVIAAPSGAWAQTPCEISVAKVFEEMVQPDPRATFVPFFSKDLSPLKIFKFTGPGPQPNMSRDLPEQQFFFNEDSVKLSAIKRKILSLPARRKKMIQVTPQYRADVQGAVEEQFVDLLAELPVKNPEMFKAEGDYLVNLNSGASLSLNELKGQTAEEGIYSLSRFVNEDLVFLKKQEGGDDFIVIGGVLAIPTRISMDTVLGETILSIHSSVSPDPEKTAKFSKMINHSLSWLFTNTKNIIKRNNFFLESDPTLSMPAGAPLNFQGPEIVDHGNYQAYSFLRAERQTLRGLIQSQVVVFTILPMVYSTGQIMTDPELARNILKGLAQKYSGDDSEEFPSQIIQYMTEDLGPTPL